MDTNPSRRPSSPRNRFADLRCSHLNQTEKQALVALALKVLQQSHRPGKELASPEKTRQYLRLRLADYRTEVFGCLFLDNAHRVLEVRELFQGTIDGASVIVSI
jgi:DNA repair protein RadC